GTAALTDITEYGRGLLAQQNSSQLLDELAPGAVGKEVFSAATGDDALSAIGADTTPLVILATGQSNIALHPAFEWSPPSNLYLWNWDGLVNDYTQTGTAFDPMDATTMGVAYSYAAQVARNNQTRRVYLINIGEGSQPISK